MIRTIKVKQTIIENIPTLLVYNEEYAPKKIAFIFHKLLQNKEAELPLAFLLAKVGYFVVLIDMRGHGKHENSFESKRFYNFNGLYKDVYDTAKDVNNIINYLRIDYPELEYENLTCIGISIGGAIALSAGYIYSNVTNVASLLGTLEWETLIHSGTYNCFRIFTKNKNVIDYDVVKNDIELYHPLKNYETMEKKPRIIFQNGLMDINVPIAFAKATFECFQSIYNKSSLYDYVKMINYERTGHQVTTKMEKDLLNWLGGEL